MCGTKAGILTWGQAKYKTGKKNEGHKFLAEANYYYGLWKGTLEFDEWNTCKEISQAEGADSVQKGGQARGRKFDAVKSELVRLLRAKVPEGGWKNKITAVDGIRADLWIFIQTENEIIKKENALLPSYKQKKENQLLWWKIIWDVQCRIGLGMMTESKPYLMRC